MSSQVSNTYPSFIFKVRHLSPDYAEQVPQSYIGPGKGPGDWKPPTIASAYNEQSEGGWYRWKSGTKITSVSEKDASRAEWHETCSMFFQAESDRFLVVPYDCTRYSVEENLDWARLFFEYKDVDGKKLSLLDFETLSHTTLYDKGRPAWMPELLPLTYNFHGPPGHSGHTALGGKLTVLVALAAFVRPPGYLLETMQTHFRPPHWTPYGDMISQGSMSIQICCSIERMLSYV